MFKNCCVCVSKKVIESHDDGKAVTEGGNGSLKPSNGVSVPPLPPTLKLEDCDSKDKCEKLQVATETPAKMDVPKEAVKEAQNSDSANTDMNSTENGLRSSTDNSGKSPVSTIDGNKIDSEVSVCDNGCYEIDQLNSIINTIPKIDISDVNVPIDECMLNKESSESSANKNDTSDEPPKQGKETTGVTFAGDKEGGNDSSDLAKCTVIVSDSDSDSEEAFAEPTPPVVRRKSSTGILKRPSIGDVSPRPARTWMRDISDDDEVFASAAVQRKRSLPASACGLASAVGRDELAMRRHRVFSELVGAARAAAEHRVRFDPLGPLVAPSAESEQQQQSNQVTPDLEKLVARLERVVSRLERVAGTLPPPSPPLLSEDPPPPPPFDDLPSPPTESATESPESEDSQIELNEDFINTSIRMSVQGFQDIMQGPLAQYMALSGQIGGDVATHSTLVQQAFNAQLQYLTMATQSAQPAQAQMQAMLMPTSQQIQAIQEFREKNRVSPLFNHLSAISESIPALGWVAVSPAPSPYVKEMNDAGQFYTNRVLKDWKEKDKKHVDWCKSWVQTLQELQAFVKQYHTTGLVWSGKGSGACPPPPPCGLPPPPPCPPPVTSFGDAGGDDRNALFAQINQGEDITKSLKKVTSDMQTHKNTTLREGPAPFKTPVGAPKPFSKSLPTPGAGQADKPPVFNRDGKKWLIEYQKNNPNLLVENAEMNNVVYMFRCRDSALSVKGKINSVVLDSCTKCAVVFDSLVSSVEFVNCQSVQMQVLGKVPTISIDKTDGCQMYLSEDSLDAEIVSSKSSEMNVLVPKGNGDFTEMPVAEQFKTTFNKQSKSLVTVAIESKG